MAVRELVVAIGVARHLPHDLALDLDPLSPAGQAGLQLDVRVDGEVIVGADARIGLMHRSAEKLFEVRDYRQVLALANRHEWLSAFASELCVALTAEQALGITPPERATWARTLLAELTRITASLALIGQVERAPALDLRERLVHLQEVATGGRLHPMFVRIGGTAAQLDRAWLDAVDVVLDDVDTALGAMSERVLASLAPFAGVGVLTHDAAIEVAATGPVGRASGIDLDLRRDAPYAAYGELADRITVPTASDGDVVARYRLLLEQLPVSIALMRACTDRLRTLGDGPHDVPLPKVVRVPEGTTYGQVESSLGVAGVLLVSTGEKAPWRLKLRTASFANVQALARGLIGTRLDQLGVVVPSFFFVMGDADR